MLQDPEWIRSGISNDQGEGLAADREESQSQGAKQDQGENDNRCEFVYDKKMSLFHAGNRWRFCHYLTMAIL